jgi:hypothetical protein
MGEAAIKPLHAGCRQQAVAVVEVFAVGGVVALIEGPYGIPRQSRERKGGEGTLTGEQRQILRLGWIQTRQRLCQ